MRKAGSRLAFLAISVYCEYGIDVERSMADGQTTHLRVYCTCGQKMRVSESMYGRPGKCVACRQKIRIPSPSEIPPGTTEVYLKDHPEFLRKPKRKPRRKEKARPPVEEREIVLHADEETPGEEPAAARGVPLDVLGILRTLCCLEHKVARELRVYDRGAAKAGSKAKAAASAQKTTKEQLLRYQSRIEAARAELDEVLRQRLMETAIELASANEKVAETGLAGRVGEMGFAEYRERMDKLRRRRDRLERRQRNLRGWLAVQDPYMAGGYRNLPLDAIPKEGFKVSLPHEQEGAQALLELHVCALLEAMTRRERAERKQAEIERMEAERSVSAGRLSAVRQEGRAERERAEAAVGFYRERLQQLRDDLGVDRQVVAAQLDLARGKLQAGEINPAQLNKAERELLRTKADVAKAEAVMARALSANTSRDVPHLRGTFLERLAKSGGERGIGVDSWLAWGAAALMVSVPFLPVWGGLSAIAAYRQVGSQAPMIQWSLTGPIVTAILLAGAAAAPDRAIRGLVVSCLWLVACLASGLFMHEAHYIPGPTAELLSKHTFWFLQPGIIIWIIAALAMGAAAAVALGPVKGVRVALPIAALSVALSLAAIFSDFGGWFRPKPAVNVRFRHAADESWGLYRSAVTVTNTGRRLLLLDSRPTSRNAFSYILEQQIGPNSWRDISVPEALEVGGLPQGVDGDDVPAVALTRGVKAIFEYTLPPGDYRVLLRSARSDTRHERDFTLPVPSERPQPVEAAEVLEESSEPQPESAGDPPGTEQRPAIPVASVELGGLITAKGKPPRFQIKVFLPNGRARQRDLSLGDPLYQSWKVTEYNPLQQTVTIANEDGMLILRRGERIPLESGG